MLHHPTHWIGVALVGGLALLALDAWGQSTGSAAVFEGRPALAGAQAGLGAQAGPAQGGIGLQGSQGAGLNLRKPRALETPRDMPQGEPAEAGRDVVASSAPADRVLPPRIEPDLTPGQARSAARAARP